DGKVEMFAKWEEYDDSYSYKAKFFHYNEPDKNKEITLNEYDCSFHTGDFNGDGKADILAIDETDDGGTTYIYDYNGNVIYENSEWPTKWHFVRTGDFNGDGYTDFLTYADGYGWEIHLNNGKDEIWDLKSLNTNMYNFNPDDKEGYSVFLSDINRDGKTDIIEQKFTSDNPIGYNDPWNPMDKWRIYLIAHINTGINSNNTNQINFNSLKKELYDCDVPTSDANFLAEFFTFPYLLSSDYNNDGYVDFAYIPLHYDILESPQIAYLFPDEQKNLVQKITNGMDQSIEISYKTLTPEAGFYETTDDAHEDIASLAGPLFVVDDVTSPNGVGGTNTVYYSYKGGKIHLKGKGFLGFNEITVNHSASNETITQEYEILKPEDQYFHTAIKKTKTLVSDELISEQTFTNQIRTYTDSKRYFPYVSVSVKNNILQNTTHTITNSYDDYGNIYSSEKDFGDGIKSYTQNLSFTDKGSYIPYLPTSVRKIYEHPDHNSSFHTITDFSYDDNGNLASKTENAHTTDKSVTTYFENYDKFGNFKRKRIAPYNMPAKTTTYEFDYNGRFVYKQTNALGSTEYTYNHATGNTLTKTGITGLKTTYQYDNWGRRTKTILPDGQEINHSTRWYTGTNVPNAVYFDLVKQDGAPYQKTYYDILGRTVRDETVGYGNRVNYTHTTYNNKGQVQEETSSLSGGEAVQSTTYTYKSDGRPETTTLPGGKTITNSYNSISTGYNVTKTIKTGGETRQYTKEYDKAGNLVKATDPGGEILYKYHANGQVKKITLANSEITMEYDNAGNQIALNDPDAGRMKYDYNALGDLTFQKDNKGNEFYLFYDNLWRLDKKTTDQAGTDIVADYAYVPSGNGIGKVQQVNGKFLDITRQYEYDQYHRTKKTIETIEGQTFTSEYHYDEHGNIHQTDYDNNLTVTRNYNNLVFLNTVKANGKFVWARENLSAREDKYYLGNNILTTNTYDNYGFPDEFEASYTSPIQKYDYAFNIQTGNLRSRQEQNGIKESFGYDNLDRLTDIGHDNTEVLSMQYNLQDKHNMNSKDDMGDVFNYTQQGNAGVHAVTSIEGLAPDAENLPEHDITWTAFNKVDQIREPDNNKHMYFTYGPEQQRKKVQYVHNHWVYDRYYSGNCEKTITNSGDRTVYYISGGSGPAAAWVKEGSDENLYYIHTDHLGSIRAITDQNRDIVARYSFDAWGNRRNPDTWQLTDNPDLSFTSRGFTGHEHIDEFGLINMNGRVYDPLTASFLSPDNYVQMPDYTHGFNRYAYAMNNPLIYIDPGEEGPVDFHANDMAFKGRLVPLCAGKYPFG
ncbi:MAG: RHS repeat-associated core domain-containing protein, partial [Bacteroidota bacterium]